ncbi:MAG: HlyC/CorC family transporter [Ichthyobacteriaceae bacterium]|nr:HlyC/CorC family transporter [Ichthyobacteriaceae bacterium]
MVEKIVIIVITILLSAFFSGMEIAFVTANRLQLELEKKQGNWFSGIVTKLTKHSSKFITTMLVGNNVALVVYGIVMGDLIISLLFPQYINSNVYPIWVLLVQTVISTLVILVTAEFIPKAIFRVYANELLEFFAIPAFIIFYLFYFLSSFIVWLSKIAIRLITGTNLEEEVEVFRKVDLGNYISEQIETTAQKEEMDVEIQMFQNALDFGGVKARECMIPRTEIISIDVNATLNELKNVFVSTGKSKILVHDSDIDDIIGYVHSFEMFKKPKEIKSILLPVEFVPETIPVNELLATLMRKHRSVALVLDEYGGTSGLITIEDIVEELFGEIEDEHDNDVLVENVISETEFIFAARLEIDYVNEKYKLNIPENEEYETIGGCVLHNLQDIPEKNQTLIIEGYRFKVLQVSNNRIEEVEISKL